MDVIKDDVDAFDKSYDGGLVNEDLSSSSEKS